MLEGEIEGVTNIQFENIYDGRRYNRKNNRVYRNSFRYFTFGLYFSLRSSGQWSFAPGAFGSDGPRVSLIASRPLRGLEGAPPPRSLTKFGISKNSL